MLLLLQNARSRESFSQGMMRGQKAYWCRPEPPPLKGAEGSFQSRLSTFQKRVPTSMFFGVGFVLMPLAVAFLRCRSCSPHLAPLGGLACMGVLRMRKALSLFGLSAQSTTHRQRESSKLGQSSSFRRTVLVIRCLRVHSTEILHPNLTLPLKGSWGVVSRPCFGI